jgi:lipoate-protein ligase A
MKPDIVSAAAAIDTAAGAGSCALTSGVALYDFKTADLGLARQQHLAEEVTSDRQRLLLLWCAPSSLIVGRADTRLRNFSDAADRLWAEGWPVVIRRSGGSACPVSRGTLQIALARNALPETTIDTAYIELSSVIRSVLESYGLKVEIREEPSAFCPGRYDMSVNGRKVAGLSQHWRQCNSRITVTTAATLIVEEDTEEIAHIVNLFYLTAGGQGRCSTSAISALRQTLPVDVTSNAPLMQDLCNRIAKTRAANGETIREEFHHLPPRVPCHKTIDLDH